MSTHSAPTGQPDDRRNGALPQSALPLGDVAAWKWTCERLIPSTTDEGKRLLDEVIRRLGEHSWQEMEIFGVHLAIEEALVNAIKHGNGYDEKKSVRVICKISPDRLFIEIEDEGKGFDPRNVPDCTDDDRLEVPSGRGLMLMRNFMSSVEFLNRGNCVVMEKRRA
ncbi:MAG: ATP-binding protein [Planctomycetia bacterium]|nr:ATP-binding protein [Planctomycetia bacterium]